MLLKRWAWVRFLVETNQRLQKWYSLLLCLTLSNKCDSVKPLPSGIDSWAGGSLARRPQNAPLLSPSQGNLGNKNIITINLQNLHMLKTLIVQMPEFIFKIQRYFAGRAVTSSSLYWEVCGSNLRPVKSDTVLPMASHYCNISPDGAELPSHNDA